ncbi:MAG: fasciclin domain-containing protein [Ferruginibacter sp.]
MIYKKLDKSLIVLFACFTVVTGCKKWDDHNAVTDAALTKNLFEQISSNSALSKFTELLTKSGYDKVIASSKTFTVFAPTNTALASLDAAIVNDTARLRKFVGNHIANQSYFTTASIAKTRILMLNGKYQNLLLKNIDNAPITESDKYANNGVLQVIDKMLPVLDNAWEALQNNQAIPAGQKAYMLSLFRKIFDPANAVQTGVNPSTGQPIYQPGTDSLQTNLFWRNVYDMRDESKEYSLFILNDAAWTLEVNKFKPFFATGTADSTTDLSRWCVVKDLAVEGAYTTLPDTLFSKFDVKVPVQKTAIVQTIKTSNGNIYIMSKVDVQPKDKIKQFYIEGEKYRTTSADRRGNTYFRDRYNAVTGKDFSDVLVFNHGLALFNINYRISDVYSMKYKAYWVAVNDFQTAAFNQRLSMGSPTATAFAATSVTANNFKEVYIGEFTLATYQSVYDIYLVAANSTTAAVNPLVCDYIRLEPSF